MLSFSSAMHCTSRGEIAGSLLLNARIMALRTGLIDKDRSLFTRNSPFYLALSRFAQPCYR